MPLSATCFFQAHNSRGRDAYYLKGSPVGGTGDEEERKREVSNTISALTSKAEKVRLSEAVVVYTDAEHFVVEVQIPEQMAPAVTGGVALHAAVYLGSQFPD